MKGEVPEPAQRLDTWLDISCVCKTRSAAARACSGGKVEVNGSRGKPHRLIRPGDVLTLTLPRGRRRILRVVSLSAISLPRARARELYDDITPPPTPEQREVARLERLLAPAPAGRPDSRERRALRRLKGK